jgi:hypothetical protein
MRYATEGQFSIYEEDGGVYITLQDHLLGVQTLALIPEELPLLTSILEKYGSMEK